MLVLLFACGDNGSVPVPDAAVDAPPPDAAMECGAPTKLCGATCIAITEDEDNCGDCGVVCKGGEACSGTCACPQPFVPATITPGQFDQFRMQGAATVAISPEFGTNGIHPILVGYSATTPLATDIDLATVPLGQLPFVAAGYGLDLGTMMTDASYTAVSGTLRLTRACATEAEGTLTNATFRGVNGGLTAPVIDPLGCTFTVPSVVFHVMTAACP
jgi:hypothetical protein